MTNTNGLTYPVKIASDLHYRIIGGKLKRPRDIRPVFQGYKTIILNGDSLEQHLYGTRKAGQHRNELESVALDVGANLIFLRGNHDPDIGPPEFRFQNKGRIVRIAHGDFGFAQLAGSPLGAHRRPISYLWYTLRTLRSYPVYWRQVSMVRDMMGDHEIFILGHTHQPSLTRDGTKIIINLGAHMRGFSDAWVEIEKEDGDLVLAGRTRTLL